MKRTLVLSLLAILAGCVKTRYIVVTPEQIQARVQRNQQNPVEVAGKQILAEAKAGQQQETWKKRLGLFCPIGGYEEVVIERRLGNESYWLPTSPLKPFIRRQIYVLRATNTENGAVEIEDTQGLMVHNLCAKGSITLVKSLEGSELGSLGIQTSGSYNTTDVLWFAGGVTSKNRLGRVQSQRGVLYTNSWQQRQDSSWLIVLKDENGRFF